MPARRLITVAVLLAAGLAGFGVARLVAAGPAPADARLADAGIELGTLAMPAVEGTDVPALRVRTTRRTTTTTTAITPPIVTRTTTTNVNTYTNTSTGTRTGSGTRPTTTDEIGGTEGGGQ